MARALLCITLVLALGLCVYSSPSFSNEKIDNFLQKSSNHNNNWAVIVDTSIFWYNYRHVANALSVYHTVKRLGIPDSNIILMLADDMACNTRNTKAGTIFNNENHLINLYGEDVQVDYRGYEVTPEQVLRVLTGRQAADVPRSKRLLTDENSNILVFMTGHGGEEFLKFQDSEEIHSADLADAFAQMWQQKRYNEILFVADTCQAATLYTRFYSPNILALGSSSLGENSYSHHADASIGVPVIDRLTYFTLEFMERVQPGSDARLVDLFGALTPQRLGSTAGVRTNLFSRDLASVRVTDFFGSEANLQASASRIALRNFVAQSLVDELTPIVVDSNNTVISTEVPCDTVSLVLRYLQCINTEYLLTVAMLVACVATMMRIRSQTKL
eukprot:TRINITY_DN15617_c0_g1_i1.p1 TRINITY_DN15617_c0_g1~~TRINITY_DN15617_c0_g1_i1.p1  ORF type:complete len:418 (+),score=97.39 TRINITY_DN15617_c0_g1_i1:95-1255(+)